ncbi:nucleotidyltransferase [Flavisolibacter tropicus]|uniref:Nucleotidyltransferase n=1 Tax=Flavisolibacter tropicus TaxID=1492898 RepID=A0A172U1P1_9BACT|nr:nucleotidyltransferase [Flavisolibacter tropicus]ANE53142.1 hypothetical protein SY85_24380 [Flavisolibacter tropicus]
MLLIEEKRTQIDDLLDKMAENLQLDATRQQRMKQHYEAVKDWIEADPVFFGPYKYDVYPHGSVRILTTVKPVEREEFDLDIAIHLKPGMGSHSPARIYAEVKRRLEAHETYKGMLEPKNRCLRLNYSGDFHMDILPGVQESEWDENKLKVPDHDLGRWVSSNPRGYADWFLAKANLVKMSLLEKALRAENLPADNFDQKKPLQRAVQLIKRYRDLYFQERFSDHKTSSIVLTTLAGMYYTGEESIFDTVDNIVSTIGRETAVAEKRIKVFNPVNPQEDFTDKWEDDPRYYIGFKAFCKHLQSEWQELKKHHGIPDESRILKGLFGESVVTKAYQSQASHLEELRGGGKLGINRTTGILSAAGSMASTVKPNTFFGA